MNVLIVGGTKFLGVHLTDALLSRGHEVTHFNRGRTDAGAREGVRSVRGDRTLSFGAFDGERFDAVVDTSGYLPDDVERAARYFAASAGRYAFVSSISVYDLTDPAPAEDSAVLPLAEGVSRTEVTGESYGPLKALCESVVAKTFGDRATILRPGLIVGPLDPTDRFTYWPVRFARGGDILLPAPADRPVQFVDARDVAAFAVRAIERDLPGTYNVTSPRGAVTMGTVADVCARVAGVPFVPHAASDDFLVESGVVEWTGLPLWVPPSAGMPGLMNVDVARATASGLRIRPLEETVHDTLAWGGSRRGTQWLTREREAELVTALTDLQERRSTTS